MIDVLKYGRPESQILLQYLVDTFSPSNIVPLHYTGAAAGSEFETYAATKLYLCLSLKIVRDNKTSGAAYVINFYNDANILFFAPIYQYAYYDGLAGAVRYAGVESTTNDFYFSRFAQTGIPYIIFTGYRLTY